MADIVLQPEYVVFALGAIGTAGMAVAGWVWTISVEINKLKLVGEEVERGMMRMDREVELNRKTTREIGNSLDRKIEAETDKLKQQMESFRDRLEEVREELPSRQFIEGQVNGMTTRIDQLIFARMHGLALPPG